jgi:hypothetical protein
MKPATFDFLGFMHICSRSRKGKFTSGRADDEEAVTTGPEGDCRMVPGEFGVD